MTTNEPLFALIAEHNGRPRALYAALVEREDAILDGLRLAAAGQGLLPSITQYTLMQTGLGTPPTPEEFVLVRTQAEAEVREVQRRLSEGGDTS